MDSSTNMNNNKSNQDVPRWTIMDILKDNATPKKRSKSRQVPNAPKKKPKPTNSNTHAVPTRLNLPVNNK